MLLPASTFDHDETFYFWVDFLCVPQDDKDVTEANVLGIRGSGTRSTLNALGSFMPSLKLQALAMMPAAYGWAGYVLVFNQELGEVTASHSELEFAARLGSCGWNSRYWTYQEQYLARRLCVRTANDAVLGQSNYGRHGEIVGWKGSIRPCDGAFEQWLLPALNHLTLGSPIGQHVSQGRDEGKSLDLEGHQTALATRTTTRRTDAAVIFATLLYLNPMEVGGWQGRDQVKAVLGSQMALPCQMLAMSPQRESHGGRFAPGDSWIPGSLHEIATITCPSRMFLYNNSLELDARSLSSIPPNRNHFSIVQIRVQADLTDPLFCECVLPGINHNGYIKVTPRTAARLQDAIHSRIGLVILLLWQGSARSTGIGACLLARSRSGNKMRAVFSHSLDYEVVDYDHGSCTEEETLYFRARTIDLRKTSISVECGRSFKLIMFEKILKV